MFTGPLVLRFFNFFQKMHVLKIKVLHLVFPYINGFISLLYMYPKLTKEQRQRESCFIQYYLYFLSSAIISLEMGCTYMYGCQTKHRKTKHLNVLTSKRRNEECDKIGKHLHLNWQWIQQSVSVHLRPFHHQT